jgi:hypothetical protein
MSDLAGKVEAALKSLIDGAGLDAGVTVNTGQSVDDLELPFAVAWCDGAGDQIQLGIGTFRLSAMVIVSSSADDSTLTEHRALVKQVFESFMTNSVEADLSAAVDEFHVWEVRFGSQPSEEEDRQMITRQEMDIVAQASNVSD